MRLLLSGRRPIFRRGRTRTRTGPRCESLRGDGSTYSGQGPHRFSPAFRGNEEPDDRDILGMAEIHVEQKDGQAFASPSLILHYVLEHHYLPPAAFCEAVLETARFYGFPA
ncbi:DUF7919 family protein [Streptantibioticus silvisoli]|uniref:DUF7919 family protein n=1 Tax=Streptantibioticus silvisoli TaxID=2705255 RepID=UPI003FD84071